MEAVLEDLTAVPSGYGEKIGAAEDFLVEMLAGGRNWQKRAWRGSVAKDLQRGR